MMAKISLNYDALQRDCIQRINDSISKLDNVINIFNGIDIPYSYDKKTRILNVKNEIIRKRKELDNVRNWIINSNNDFNSVINLLNSSSDKLSKAKFGSRKEGL